MSRRSTRKVVIPEGFTLHDGRGCPLPDEDRPFVVTRMGTHMKGYSCAQYATWAEDPWTWHAEHPGAGDIIAYQSEFVEIPRLSYEQLWIPVPGTYRIEEVISPRPET